MNQTVSSNIIAICKLKFRIQSSQPSSGQETQYSSAAVNEQDAKKSKTEFMKQKFSSNDLQGVLQHEDHIQKDYSLQDNQNSKPSSSTHLGYENYQLLSPDRKDAKAIKSQQNLVNRNQTEIELQYVNSIDLENISLSNSDLKSLDKFYLRRNYALALTKKKEVLFWGQIINPNQNIKFGTSTAQSAASSRFQDQSQQSQFNNLNNTNAKGGQLCMSSVLQMSFIVGGINTVNSSEANGFIEVISASESVILNDPDILEKQSSLLLSKRFSFFKSIRISEICCNDFAAHFLSEDGMLYSMGKDHKKYGILGMGTVYEVPSPAPNNSLIDYRISRISMGLSHCCALTSGGQLYSWGTGQNGQLCHSDDTMFSNLPKLVQSSRNMHITQIYCSSYYTLLINAKGQLSMFGTLKGFAKFLFDSPTKEKSKDSSTGVGDHSGSGNNNSSDYCSSMISNDRSVRRVKLKLQPDEKVYRVALAEKAFLVQTIIQPQSNLTSPQSDLKEPSLPGSVQGSRSNLHSNLATGALSRHPNQFNPSSLKDDSRNPQTQIQQGNLYFVGDNFVPELILSRRDLKSFQFLNGQKYIVIHDTNNILMVMSQQSTINPNQNILNENLEEKKDKWEVIKEFNLIQQFNTQDIEMLPQDSNQMTRKAQSLQLLTFITNSNSKLLQNNFNKKYYKTFLNQHKPQNQLQNGGMMVNAATSSQLFQMFQQNLKTISSHNGAILQHQTPQVSQLQSMNFGEHQMLNQNETSILSESKYAPMNPYESSKTRNKLKLKIDSIFGNTFAFSARKGRSNSTSIKERAKKLHQSLSPIQRFPIINNLCEIIKQQKLGVGVNNGLNGMIALNNVIAQNARAQNKSPPKFMASQSDTPYQLEGRKMNPDTLKSPQYNLLLQSLNLACQLSSMGNVNQEGLQPQSQKQIQFLSKADKIRQELNKKPNHQNYLTNHSSQQQTMMQHTINNHTNTQGNADLIEIASPNCSRQENQSNSHFPLMEEREHQSKLLDQYARNQDMPLQSLQSLNVCDLSSHGAPIPNSHQAQKFSKNLSCILEDRENNSTIIQAQPSVENRDREPHHAPGSQIKRQDDKTNHNAKSKRQPSWKVIPDYPHKLLDSHKKFKQDVNMLNIDTISEISGILPGRDSMHRFSQYGGASDLTNTNNYKILVMNARNVIEKKLLQHLMVGFMGIKYFQGNTLQSFQLHSTVNYSQQNYQNYRQVGKMNEDNYVDQTQYQQNLEFELEEESYVADDVKIEIQNDQKGDQIEKGLKKLKNIVKQKERELIYKGLNELIEHDKKQKARKRVFKKIASMFKQKEEQFKMEALTKMQLQIRFKKLQRLNINVLFNSISKILKRLNKVSLNASFSSIHQKASLNRREQAVEFMKYIIDKHSLSTSINAFHSNKERVNRAFKSLKLMKKAFSQILFRKHLNQKSRALYLFKKNVLSFNQNRSQMLLDLVQRREKRVVFKRWQVLVQKRKAAIQQAIFLKMFIQDKLKQIKYFAIIKMINFSNLQSQSQSKKSNLSASHDKGNWIVNAPSNVEIGVRYEGEINQVERYEYGCQVSQQMSDFNQCDTDIYEQLATCQGQNELLSLQLQQVELPYLQIVSPQPNYNSTKTQHTSTYDQVSRKLEFVERSVQNEDMNFHELDIEDTQLDDGDYYQINHPKKKNSTTQAQNLPLKKSSGKEFSFEKYELGALDYPGQENNTTAYFNRFNLMSKAKESSHQVQTSALKDCRPNYHCHYADGEKVAPEAFTLEPSFVNNTRNSISISQGQGFGGASHSRQPSTFSKNISPHNQLQAMRSSHIVAPIGKMTDLSDLTDAKDYSRHKEHLQFSQASKIRMSIQDEISPTNNFKNYQRQALLNKNYEQADPFELPANDDGDIPVYQQVQLHNPLLHNKMKGGLQKVNDYGAFTDKYFNSSDLSEDFSCSANDQADKARVYDDKDIQQQQNYKLQEKPREEFHMNRFNQNANHINEDCMQNHRYSIKNVLPFNPPEDTPTDSYLRQKQLNQRNIAGQNLNLPLSQSQNTKHIPPSQQLFEMKKNSNASSIAGSQKNGKDSQKSTFINNYFTKLSVQNSIKNESKAGGATSAANNSLTASQFDPKASQVHSSQNPSQIPNSTNKENQAQYSRQNFNSHHSSQNQQYYQHHQSSQHPLTSASFVTNNNHIDIMHFNSQSDNTSFVFFDDNFYRESGISSASRFTSKGKLGPLVNQSFGQGSSHFQNQLTQTQKLNQAIAGGATPIFQTQSTSGPQQTQQQQQLLFHTQHQRGKVQMSQQLVHGQGSLKYQFTNGEAISPKNYPN